MIQMLCVRLLNFVIDIRTKEFFFLFFLSEPIMAKEERGSD